MKFLKVRSIAKSILATKNDKLTQRCKNGEPQFTNIHCSLKSQTLRNYPSILVSINSFNLIVYKR